MASAVVSHYELIEQVGKGGGAIVYKAWDLHVPRFVALKFVYPHLLESEEALRRFQDEARAVCSLSHPNVVVLHDLDMDPETGRVFLVLEYLPGGTLRQLIQDVQARGSQLGPLEICSYGRAVAAGLAHAHRRGIIHRDVKSSNVMFSEERIVKVTDFGLAKSATGLDLTQTGFAAGTPAYMSPEQARGQKADPRTDIYSLGIVLYEMAAARLPFDASDPFEVLRMVVDEPTPPLGDVVPEPLEGVIQRATAKRPEDRYQSMEELESELAATEHKLRSLSELSTVVHTPTPRPAPPPARPAPRRLRALLAVPLLPAVLAALWWFGYLRVGTPPAAASTLAVLPFQCLGADEPGRAFCEGLAHTISMKLTQMEAYQDRVLVVPFSEIRGERVTSSSEARKVFRVKLAVTGSVQFLGDLVRVNLILVDAEKKVQTRAEMLDCPRGSLARLQEDTSTVAASMLAVQLPQASRDRLAAGATRNEEAFNEYVRGVGYLARSGDIEDARNAARHLERAVTADPSYALAHAHLGEAYLRQYEKTQDRSWVDRALENCERARKLNDQLAKVHIALAQVFLARTEEEKAVGELKLALRLEPKNADALRALGSAYVRLGLRAKDQARKDEGLRVLQQAIALRPDLWTTYRDFGGAYRILGDNAKAAEQFQRMVTLTESAEAYRLLGNVYHFGGRSEEAIAMYRKSIAVKPNPEAYSNLGVVYYYLRRYDEMIPNYEKAVELSDASGTRDFKVWGNLAMAYMRRPGMEAKGRAAFQEAIKIAEARLQASPGEAPTHASLAYFLVRTGDRAGALRHVRQAQDLAADSGEAQFRCALVYEELKRRDDALAALKRAVANGRPMTEVMTAGGLKELRKDPRFTEVIEAAKAGTTRGLGR